jgi:hypothetical protein
MGVSLAKAALSDVGGAGRPAARWGPPGLREHNGKDKVWFRHRAGRQIRVSPVKPRRQVTSLPKALNPRANILT